MSTFYIICNGFDLYHSLDRHYRSLGLYLQKQYGTLYDQLLKHFDLPDISENDSKVGLLWRGFEHGLFLLDVDLVYSSPLAQWSKSISSIQSLTDHWL